MKKIIERTKSAASNRCVQFNALMTALTPALDHAMQTFPLLREHLPANAYAIGFAIIVLGNIVIHFRAPMDDKGE